MAKATAPARKPMSADHKSALAQGRQEGLVVRRYLEALAANKPKRGRRRTEATINARITAIATELEGADALTKLHLTQERKDLESELDSMNAATDLTELEAGFVEVAATYGARKGIDYSTWREAGVDARVLKAAGVRRTRSA